MLRDRLGVLAQVCDCKYDDCGFDLHSKHVNNKYFHCVGYKVKARSRVPPFYTQCLENSA